MFIYPVAPPMNTPDATQRLNTALESLLPAGVRHATSRIPARPIFRFQAEAKAMRTAGDYRQSEFVAGRDCARAALAQIGYPEQPILADADGVPAWPAGALGAISHSRGYCGAVAARQTDYRILGLDLEKTNRLSRAAIERVVHPQEQGYVEGDQRKASLIFSAKEAFFKAQYPSWQTHANFHDLVLAVEGSDIGRMTIRDLAQRFPDDLCALAPDIRFRFRYFEDFVVTLCWMEQ